MQELPAVTQNASWSSTDPCGFVEATQALEAPRRSHAARIEGMCATRPQGRGNIRQGGDDE
jgi:hypothetical protein